MQMRKSESISVSEIISLLKLLPANRVAEVQIGVLAIKSA